MRLESAHLVLTPIQFTDANDIHQAIRESITDLKTQFVWAEEPYTLRHAQTLVQESVANQREGKALTFGIRSKTGRMLGALSVHEVPDMLGKKVPMHKIEVWIRQSDQNQGFWAEALQVATDAIIKSLGSRRVFAHVLSPEVAKIYQNAGYQLEATLTNAHMGEGGQPAPVMIMAKTA
ncbi:MAG: GNAT family protein [Alphaproteobacteria bacterium]